ncbi:hypothetical protein L486_02439 [Kwoniella mangroviensis CBS 10435]|uniref:Uncharacterized protein n=1 Tax=Kwoniella mangroviensis CBS 10435 TaxID=1331196 RepID=A0A1B9IW72_9TREE|nr:uncharacterized protein I203_01721 [Kwoniella mangroviensis CBS 8507]OCF59766.1 hypothetical protein L486_02439 [Kwoniella mangroviensis CBS 10435]OCF69857.1 hypothetical protein I203_01721 [Kwoniella mangroviensis CBS 8507]
MPYSPGNRTTSSSQEQSKQEVGTSSSNAAEDQTQVQSQDHSRSSSGGTTDSDTAYSTNEQNGWSQEMWYDLCGSDPDMNPDTPMARFIHHQQ